MAPGVNNATTRLAEPIGTVAVPSAAGREGWMTWRAPDASLDTPRALQVAAVLCAAAAVLAPLTLRTCSSGRPISHPNPTRGCLERTIG